MRITQQWVTCVYMSYMFMYYIHDFTLYKCLVSVPTKQYPLADPGFLRGGANPRGIGIIFAKSA